jgi:hypothetical protein
LIADLPSSIGEAQMGRSHIDAIWRATRAVLVVAAIILTASRAAAAPHRQAAPLQCEISDPANPVVLTQAGGPYLADCRVRIMKGGVLSIEAGAVVQFGENGAVTVESGTLNVNGTATSSVVLTSSKDVKGAGDWRGISVEKNGQASLHDLTILYAGRQGAPALSLGSMSNTVTNTLTNAVIEQSASVGLKVTEVNADIQDVSITQNAGSGILIDDGIKGRVGVTLRRVKLEKNAEAVSSGPNVNFILQDNSARSNAVNGIVLKGTITQPVTWPGGDLPFVIPQQVNVQERLTLLPKAVVKFQSSGTLNVTETPATRGRLSALGSPDGKIYFTSVSDDDACTSPKVDCDTMNDGASTSLPGSWQHIAFQTGSRGAIANAELRYGGDGLVSIATAGVGVTNTLFTQSKGSGVVLTNVGASIVGSRFIGNGKHGVEVRSQSPVTVTLRNSEFRSNGAQSGGAVVTMAPDVTLLSGGNTVPAFDNGVNGYLVSTGNMTIPHVWLAGDLPYVVQGTIDLKVRAPGQQHTLTLQPGLTVKMRPRSGIRASYGSLLAGAAGSPRVLITSDRDDACTADVDTGCDTNGDGFGTTPQEGDWDTITIVATAQDSALVRTIIRYGGTSAATNAMIDVEHPTSIEDCEIALSNSTGLRVSLVTYFELVGNDIHHNKSSGVVLRADQAQRVVFRDNQIHDNGDAAIDMDANSEIQLEGNNVAERNRLNGIAIHGSSTIRHTWRATSLPYLVVGSVDVGNNSELTIEPGTVVKMSNDADFKTSFGKLTANGTVDKPIIFTSIRDDVLNDSNPLDGDVEPNAGDWGSVIFSDTGGGGSLTNVEIRYAGSGSVASVQVKVAPNNLPLPIRDSVVRDGAGPGIQMFNVGARIENVTVRDMRSSGIRIVATSRPVDATLQGNTITGCVAAVEIDASTQLTLSGNTATGNAINGVLVSGTVVGTRRWVAGDLVYVLGPQVTVSQNATLELGAGLIVKGQPGSAVVAERGALVVPASGTGDQPVTLTAVRDDTVCDARNNCDTNGDGTASKPAPGDWQGLTLGRSATRATLKNVHLYYAGATNAALTINLPNATVDSCDIAYSLTDGIRVEGGGAAIKGASIRDNVGIGLVLEGTIPAQSSVVVDGNVFTGNGRSMSHRVTGNVTTANNVAIGNTKDAMLYCAAVQTTQTWYNDLPREVTCNIDVKTGAELTIEPGTVLQMGTRLNINVLHRLLAEGITLIAAIEEPSIREYWGGINFAAGSFGYVRHSLLVNGGTMGQGMVDVRSKNSVQVTDNLLMKASGTGISIYGADTNALVRSNLLRDVDGASANGVRVDTGSAPTIKYNRIAGVDTGMYIRSTKVAMLSEWNNMAETRSFGIKNEDSTVCVDGQLNWWGDKSGPYDPTVDKRDPCRSVVGDLENKNGTGSPVSNGVNYLNWLKELPPTAPMLDSPRCGVTNQRAQAVGGWSSANALISVYDGQNENPIQTAAAGANGRFDLTVNLSPGEHRLSFDASVDEAKSARTSYRVLDIQPDLIIDPAGVYFEYGPAASRRRQPVHDVAGCATGCNGITSGRVALPPNVPVRVRVPVTGAASAVEFSQPGQTTLTMTNSGGIWQTSEFTPVQGPFTIQVKPSAGQALEFRGYVYPGGDGFVYADSGVKGPPLVSYDFETGSQGWTAEPPWTREEEQLPGQTPDHNWYMVDRPGAGASETRLSLNQYLDLRDTVAPTLHFQQKYILAKTDHAYVEVKVGDSGNWATVADITGQSGSSTGELRWIEKMVTLDKYAGTARLYLRFRLKALKSDVADRAWYIDNVWIGPGGALNGRYDLGEPLISGATVYLRQRNPDTGAWREWIAGSTNQVNPQETDEAGRYGFFYLPAGEYQLAVDPPHGNGYGPQKSPSVVVWNGSFAYNVPLVGGTPIYLPVVVQKFMLR